ncbi:MAG: hypothetical protein F4201_01490 [Nitrospira sp. SB0677_bin_15]|nr:hypothetical protein [Nitrospira sp. SB0667_bin_9]MYD32221.1 hypothetical protein [Nitrospira sp. SB0661_bin_20]MYG39493.1 hypothetical protein [Nitrospira sp. SB0677_bin_15]MYH01801.1 hypothetical protein [Nitrospira sp. SB0675_bin_23]MYJ23618.1 hypothetical protein [Nitrospira sp. SB0673_bin_12]
MIFFFAKFYIAKFFIFWLLVFAAYPNVLIAGSMDDAIQDGKNFAVQENAVIRDIPQNLDPDTMPNYQGTDVPEKNYYSSTSLTHDAQTYSATDPSAQYITNARTTRPAYVVDPKTNPLLTHKPANEIRMTALTQTYTGCDSVNIPHASVAVCGSQLICPDGNCTADVGQTHTPSTAGFARAASYLSVLQEMTDTLDTSTLEVFRGENKRCKDNNFGFFTCCQNPGHSQCNAMERELRIDRDEQRTHYVGRYKNCDVRLLFFCALWRDYKSYCTFPSKLARIVVVQGRAQIGKAYGGPRNPDCSGFTLQELPTIDFESIDLSEYHADVIAEANAGATPAVVDAVDDIKTKIKDRHQELQ